MLRLRYINICKTSNLIKVRKKKKTKQKETNKNL